MSAWFYWSILKLQFRTVLKRILLIFSIMDVFSISGAGTVLTGEVLSGSLVPGDPVCIPLIDGETAACTVEGIEMRRKFLHSNCEPEDVSDQE